MLVGVLLVLVLVRGRDARDGGAARLGRAVLELSAGLGGWMEPDERGVAAPGADGGGGRRGGDGGGGGGGDAGAGATDFLSWGFDAAVALRTEGLQPPEPRVRALDNVAMCRRLLPPDVEGSAAAQPPRQKQELSAEQVAAKERAKARADQFRAQQAAQQEARERHLPTLLDLAARGPLQLLARAVAEGSRVRVVTRHSHGVRGVAVGHLRAFDRRMNLVLHAADEDYTVMVPCKRVSASGLERPGRRAERRTRHMQQVFVRGDSVVLVSLVAGEGPPG